MKHLIKAAGADDRTLAEVAGVGPERRRLAFVTEVQASMSRLLSVVSENFPDSPAAAVAAFDSVLRRKGLAAEVWADQRDAVIGERFGRSRQRFEELIAVRRELGERTIAWTADVLNGGLRRHRRRLAELATRREELEVELALELPDFRAWRKIGWGELRGHSCGAPSGVGARGICPFRGRAARGSRVDVTGWPVCSIRRTRRRSPLRRTDRSGRR